MSATMERRYTPGTVSLRGADGGGKKLGGYAVKWNTLSRNLGGFVEQVAPGAFTKSVTDKLDVLARFQHRDEFLLGRVASQTLRLAIDDEGLDYEVDLPADHLGERMVSMAGRGDLRYSSFAFFVLPNGDEWSLTAAGFPLRTLLAAQLYDVAPVVDPAYLDTSTGLRSLAERRGMDLAEVAAAAQANTLAEVIGRGNSPTVIDTGNTTTPAQNREHGATGGQVDNHPSMALRQRRVALLGRRNPARQVDNHPAPSAR